MTQLRPILILVILFIPAIGYATNDFVGTRPLGRAGAYRANATGNDAIFFNPAGMSLFQRYSFEAQYVFSPDFLMEGGPEQHIFNASVVDNQIQQFATGLSYTRVERGEDKNGNRIDLAFSFPFSDQFLVGVNFKYVNFDIQNKSDAVDAVSVDIGGLLRTDFGLAIGVVGYNLTNTADYVEHPISMAAAIMYSPFRTLDIAFDWFIDFQKPKDPNDPLGEKETAYSYHFGAEYLLLQQFTLRAGFQIDQTQAGDDRHRWSAGIGYINPRVAVDFGFLGSLQNSWDNTFAFGIRLFM